MLTARAQGLKFFQPCYSEQLHRTAKNSTLYTLFFSLFSITTVKGISNDIAFAFRYPSQQCLLLSLLEPSFRSYWELIDSLKDSFWNSGLPKDSYSSLVTLAETKSIAKSLCLACVTLKITVPRRSRSRFVPFLQVKIHFRFVSASW